MARIAVAGAQHVLAFQKAGDAGLAGRQAAEHQGAVGYGLVAGHADRAGKRRPARRGGWAGLA